MSKNTHSQKYCMCVCARTRCVRHRTSWETSLNSVCKNTNDNSISVLKAPSKMYKNINWMRHFVIVVAVILFGVDRVYVLNDRTICYNACYSLSENPAQCVINTIEHCIVTRYINVRRRRRARTIECMWDVESCGFSLSFDQHKILQRDSTRFDLCISKRKAGMEFALNALENCIYLTMLIIIVIT